MIVVLSGLSGFVGGFIGAVCCDRARHDEFLDESAQIIGDHARATLARIRAETGN